MAIAGAMSPEQRTVFESAARRMIVEVGVTAIILGGTDLALAFDPANSTFPLIDCAAIHVRAIADRAMIAAELP